MRLTSLLAAFLVLLLESARVSQGRGVNGRDRQISFYLGHAESNNNNDETYIYGEEQKTYKYPGRNKKKEIKLSAKG